MSLTAKVSRVFRVRSGQLDHRVKQVQPDQMARWDQRAPLDLKVSKGRWDPRVRQDQRVPRGRKASQD